MTSDAKLPIPNHLRAPKKGLHGKLSAINIIYDLSKVTSSSQIDSTHAKYKVSEPSLQICLQFHELKVAMQNANTTQEMMRNGFLKK